MGKLKLSNEIGLKGEEIACKYLKSKGYLIIDRNYRQNWGEIDIIAEKAGRPQFFEVKTVSCEIIAGVPRVTGHRPEENVNTNKQERLKRIIQTYLQSKYKTTEVEFDFGILSVYLNVVSREAKVVPMWNVVL